MSQRGHRKGEVFLSFFPFRGRRKGGRAQLSQQSVFGIDFPPSDCTSNTGTRSGWQGSGYAVRCSVIQRVAWRTGPLQSTMSALVSHSEYSQINTADVVDGVFADQHGVPSTDHKRRDPCWVEDFLPKPSDVQVSVSLMPVSSSCFEAVSDSLRIQCGWIYNQRTWNTMHKHLLRISKYYFLALPQHI